MMAMEAKKHKPLQSMLRFDFEITQIVFLNHLPLIKELNMRHAAATTILTAAISLSACAAPLNKHSRSPYISDATHGYELFIKDSADEPVEGALVSFSTFSIGQSDSEKTECITDAAGICKSSITVPCNPTGGVCFFTSAASYSVSKTDFYSNSGSLTSSFSSPESNTKENPVKATVVLYRPIDYISEALLT